MCEARQSPRIIEILGSCVALWINRSGQTVRHAATLGFDRMCPDGVVERISVGFSLFATLQREERSSTQWHVSCVYTLNASQIVSVCL
jgi:hypothetical protein